jgi:hypothetical protein
MSRLEFRFAFCLLLNACVAASPVPQECPRAFGTALPLDSVRLEQLVGTYDVSLVPTSYGLTRHPIPARLVLAPRESLRVHFPEAPSRLGARCHLRSVVSIGSPGHRRGSKLVELDGGVLYVGCRQCLDGSPDRLRIERVGAGGSWGHWDNPQTGLWRIVDTAGRPLPNPSGIYCAVPADSSRRWLLNVGRMTSPGGA